MSISQVLSIIAGIAGGLCLFLFGMQMMSEGMQKAAGNQLQRIIELLTSNRFLAVITGTVTTMLVQSSSTTTVMVVGFVNAGIMNLIQAVGVILGANIGTTITAQMISFKLGALALPAIAIGFGMTFLSQKKTNKYYGEAVLGFGILFLGMNTMSGALSPLRSYEPFLSSLATFAHNPFLGVLAGAVFTAILQSSSASTGIIVALALQGLLTLPSAIPLILGTNIGTSITAVLACIGTSLTARRAAIAHVVFNVFGVVVFMIFLKPFSSFVAITGDTVARQIANGHTIFNIINTILVIPFINQFSLLITKIVPGKEIVIERGPKYLDKRLINTPLVAINLVIKEMTRMGELSSQMFKDAGKAVLDNDKDKIKQVYRSETIVNELERAIVSYLAEVSQRSLTKEQSIIVTRLMHIVHDMERIGDLSENIIELADAKIEDQLDFSQTALDELKDMFDRVERTIVLALDVFEHDSPYNKASLDKVNTVIEAETDIDRLEKHLRQSHILRLTERKCIPISGIIFLEIISICERIADHARNIAQIALENDEKITHYAKN